MNNQNSDSEDLYQKLKAAGWVHLNPIYQLRKLIFPESEDEPNKTNNTPQD